MKYMKIGTRPDTFYTEAATRTIASDVTSDLILRINNINYHLHKFPLLPKCGLLQHLCSDADDAECVTVDLHDIPGGEDAFELCAKYCYGISINLSAYNFVQAFCAAKFLRMTESVEKGNFVMKLEAFFNSCILEGWKDSIVALQSTTKIPEWSENLGIIKRCIDSIIEKVLTPTAKVTWSFTYTRAGYSKKQRQSVPRDWWTEDIADLEIDLFRCIIITIKSTNVLLPQLIGEALHVYACRWLPDISRTRPTEVSDSASQSEENVEKNRRVLEAIVSMIPGVRGSVSVNFLLRLLSIARRLGASSVTKTELIRKASLQLEEATLSDMLLPSHSSTDECLYDVELMLSVVESFYALWRRQHPGSPENGDSMRSMRTVGKLVDSYLQAVAKDVNMPVSKMISLAETLPDISRADHDDLYKAINTYLKEHPGMSKEDKKRLCRILDCQKLSPEVRAHAVKNERLPLRTVVQVLFFDNEKVSQGATSSQQAGHRQIVNKGKQTPLSMTSSMMDEPRGKDHQKMMRADSRLMREFERKLNIGETEELESEKVMDVAGARMKGSKSGTSKVTERSKSAGQGHISIRER